MGIHFVGLPVAGEFDRVPTSAPDPFVSAVSTVISVPLAAFIVRFPTPSRVSRLLPVFAVLAQTKLKSLELVPARMVTPRAPAIAPAWKTAAENPAVPAPITLRAVVDAAGVAIVKLPAMLQLRPPLGGVKKP
jgi:hypothetical protein